MDVPTERGNPSHTDTRGLRIPAHEILDQLPAAIYTCDVEGRITYYNRAAADLWGREPVIGKEFWCGSFRLSKADGAPVALDQCPMALALKEADQTLYDGSLIVWRPDGERRYVTVNPRLICDDAGRICGAVNQVTDITARVRAEKERRASELTLSRLLALLPVGVASCNADGQITFFNQKATDLWGQAPNGDDLFDFLNNFEITLANGTRLPMGAPLLKHLLRDGRSLRDVSIAVRRPDGSRIALGVCIECLRCDKGGDHGAVAMFQDISERDRHEQAIRHLAAIVESSEDAIVSKDLNGTITTWNEGAQKNSPASRVSG